MVPCNLPAVRKVRAQIPGRNSSRVHHSSSTTMFRDVSRFMYAIRLSRLGLLSQAFACPPSGRPTINRLPRRGGEVTWLRTVELDVQPHNLGLSPACIEHRTVKDGVKLRRRLCPLPCQERACRKIWRSRSVRSSHQFYLGESKN